MKQNEQGFFEMRPKPFSCLCQDRAVVKIEHTQAGLLEFIVACPRAGCAAVKVSKGLNPDGAVIRWNQNVEDAIETLKAKIEKEKAVLA